MDVRGETTEKYNRNITARVLAKAKTRDKEIASVNQGESLSLFMSLPHKLAYRTHVIEHVFFGVGQNSILETATVCTIITMG